MSDRAGDRHRDEHEGDRDELADVVERNVLESREHQNAHVDQRGRGRSRRDDRRDRRDEHAGEEEDARRQRCETRAAARFDAGRGFHEGRDRGGSGEGARDGADVLCLFMN